VLAINPFITLDVIEKTGGTRHEVVDKGRTKLCHRPRSISGTAAWTKGKTTALWSAVSKNVENEFTIANWWQRRRDIALS